MCQKEAFVKIKGPDLAKFGKNVIFCTFNGLRQRAEGHGASDPGCGESRQQDDIKKLKQSYIQQNGNIRENQK